MPSTYSSNLRLELIASGEQANTWGNTTNTNLGTLLEEAIAGVVDIDISAGNKTLSALNGAYDEARAMVIVATGSAGFTRNIITPANVSKVYILRNDSTTDVNIATAASGFPVAVTVPSGTAKLVYTDGTDFFEANNSAGVFEADTVTITGTPTNSTDAATVGYITAVIAALNTFTASRAIVSNGSGNLAASSVTSTELGYLSGVTSNIQTQLNAKAPTTSGTAILKGNGTGGFSNAVAGTDYAPVTSGTSILYGNGAGGFSNATIGTGLSFAGGTLSSTVAPIPAGSVMLFIQAAAPTGWTKSTANNDKALRIVSGSGGGTGGSVAFSTAFVNGNAGATTLSTSQIPSHSHTFYWAREDVASGGVYLPCTSGAVMIPGTNNTKYTNTDAILSTGGGESHTHSLSLAVQYVDAIICVKD